MDLHARARLSSREDTHESKLGIPFPPEILPSVQLFLIDAEAQLKSTDHFGVLGELIEKSGKRSTRFEYVVHQCVLLHRLKKTVPGLGLGSSNNFPPAGSDSNNEWKAVRSMTGLEIVQSWAVLLNAGHLFGTFATERPLLFELDRKLPLRQEFIAAVCASDMAEGNPLRTHAELALDRARLHSFHTLLALWRLREGGSSKLEGSLRRQAQLLLKAFCLPPTDKLRSLQLIFRRVRRLAYLQKHGALQSTPYTLRDLLDSDLRSLFPEDAVPEADWVAGARWAVFQSLDRFDAETLFASSEAAAEILAHVAEFKEWWAKTEPTPSGQIDALFVRPQDWPTRTPRDLHHFIELRVPSTLGWLHEVRHWLRNDQEINPWGESEFFVSPYIDDQILRIDLYSPSVGMSTTTFKHVLAQIARPFSNPADTKHQQALWMSASRLAARAFETMLSPSNHLRLRPTPATSGHVGYATVGATYEFVRGRVKGFLPISADQQRSRELRQLLAIADDVVGWRSVAFVLLARAEILSESVGGSEMLAELDGVLGFFRGDSLFWLIVETKKAGGANGEKQLREKFFPTLKPGPTPAIQSRKHGPEHAWFAVFPSPPFLDLPRIHGSQTSDDSV